MRANSLALRLFVSATAWAVIILFITGIVLSSLYRHAVERSFDRRLNVYLRTLVADLAAPEDAGGVFPQSIGEPLFELPLSGWYWQVTRLDPGKHEVRASRSLWDRGLPHLQDEGVAPGPDGSREGYVVGPEQQSLRQVERDIDLGNEGHYLVAVAGDAAEIDGEINSFDQALAITFTILAAVLLLTTMFQVRFGLAPLKRITDSLAAIRAGRGERLTGEFPEEIAPLARETNALIDANREIVERARTHVGNLAHALKTPLSVMVNEASARPSDPLAGKVLEQAAIIRDQVARHLERARLAARHSVVGTVTDVTPVVTALVRTMEKIHHDRGLAVDVRADDVARFRGERPDLEEMLGNLVDNACKWAGSRVSIEVVRAPGTTESDTQTVRITVDDDGPGLSAAEREQAAKRGLRLDESKPGSGLGLSIVTDLAALYGGDLKLGAAPYRRLARGTRAAGGVRGLQARETAVSRMFRRRTFALFVPSPTRYYPPTDGFSWFHAVFPGVVMSTFKFAAIAAIGLLLAGCAGSPDGSGPGPRENTGTLLGAGTGALLGAAVAGGGTGDRLAGAAIGGLVGGLIGNRIGASLDEQDRRRAYAAEENALEHGRSGVATSWRNPDSGHYGAVVPGPAYVDNGRHCRSYTHTIYIGGQPQTARGVACRNPDGTWTAQS